MTRPTEVYVGGVRFRILWEKQAFIAGDAEVVGAYGSFDAGAATIRIATDVPKRVAREAAQHELLHAIWYTTGLIEAPKLKEEPVVKALSFGLWAVQGDPRNRAFLDWVYA